MSPAASLAIVGLAARFTGARDVDELWFDMIRERPAGTHQSALGPESPEPDGIDPELFDPELLEPELAQETAGAEADKARWLGSRLLEVAHAAIENAGHDPARIAPGCGLFAVATPLVSGVLEPVARQLDLAGPVVAVRVAEDSLDVIRQAGHALVDGSCDHALVVGATGSAAVPAGATGAVAVLVRRLPDALADHDHIWAVVHGITVDIPEEALTAAEVTADDLSRVVRAGSDAISRTLGDLGPVAGIAALVELALAMEREQVPPAGSEPVRSWPRNPDRRRCAALTDATRRTQLVVDEPPVRPVEAATRQPRVVAWSARTPAAELATRDRLARWFVWHGDQQFGDAIATLQDGRAGHPVRAAAVCSGALDAAAVLGSVHSPRLIGPRSGPSLSPRATPGPTWWFPGSLDRDGLVATHGLYEELPTFAVALEDWFTRFETAGIPLRDSWWATGGGAATSPDGMVDAAGATAVAMAVAAVWQAAGVRPARSFGDGIGAVAAAAVTEALGTAEMIERLRTATSTEANGPDRVDRSARPVRTPDPTDLWLQPAGSSRSEAIAGLLTDAARLWVEGHTIDWGALGQPPLRHRVPLPSYPYQRGGRPPESADPFAASDGSVESIEGVRHPLAAATVRATTPRRGRPRIEVLTPPNDGPLVVAIPYAGGSGRAFQALRRQLPTGWGLGVVDLPGHGMSMAQECLHHVEAVVSGLHAAVTERVERPPVLLGYSLGGSFAYELAQRLCAAGTPPAGVLVCASRAAQTGIGHPPVAQLPAGTPFLRAAVGLGIAAPEMLEIPELAEAFGGVLQADLMMVESFPYDPDRPPLSVPGCVIGMDADWLVPEPALRAWSELFALPPRQVRMTGGHLVLHEDEHAFGAVVRDELVRLVADGRAVGSPVGRFAPSPAGRVVAIGAADRA